MIKAPECLHPHASAVADLFMPCHMLWISKDPQCGNNNLPGMIYHNLNRFADHLPVIFGETVVTDFLKIIL